jgi:predicted GNAT family N-acyltransferase
MMDASSSESNNQSGTFRIRKALWTTDHEALRMIRRQVFVIEQQVPAQLEWDGQDEEALHLVAEDESTRAIGTARLLNSGQIGRMAVLKEWRREGVGGRLLKEILAVALQEDYPAPWLNAQVSVIDFYTKNHFYSEGERFLEAGITHQRMVYKECY